uniref:Uncharacterized protein n=1 Tax=Trichogramma kaykai TaxID=54128 RepID=A0ABD2XMZ1_9HYME
MRITRSRLHCYNYSAITSSTYNYYYYYYYYQLLILIGTTLAAAANSTWSSHTLCIECKDRLARVLTRLHLHNNFINVKDFFPQEFLT